MGLSRTKKVVAGAVLSIATLSTALTMVSSAFAATIPTTSVTSTTTAHAVHHGKHKAPNRAWLFRALANDLHIKPSVFFKELHQGDTVTQIATKQNVAATTLQSDLQTIVSDHFSALVTKGKMTQQKATQIEQKLDAKLPTLVNRKFPMGHHAKHKSGNYVWLFQSIAKNLNVQQKTLVKELHQGNTLAQIATKQNVAATTLQSDLQTVVSDHFSALVTKGKMTQQKATQIEQKLDAKLPTLVNRKFPMGHKKSDPTVMAMKRAGMLKEVSTILHLTPQQLHQDLHSGQTITEIAAKQQVSSSTLTSGMQSYFAQRTNQAITKWLSKN